MKGQFGMICLAVSCLLFHRNSLFAQELEPRNYSVLPVNFNVAAFSYTFSHGNIVTDATAPVKDLVVSSSTIAPAFVHTFGLFKKLARIQVIIPYVFLSGTAKVNGVDTAA